MAPSAVNTMLEVDFLRGWLLALATVLEEECDQLTRLDAAIGDADHGVNMRRGFRAVRWTLTERPSSSPSQVLSEVGKRLIVTVGGASGPLYGTALRRLGTALPDAGAFTADDLSVGLRAALTGVQDLGAARVGDKTMVDAFAPAVEALEGALVAGRPFAEAAGVAAEAAQRGMVSTIPLRALKGRASYLGARSEGHQDPGATSTAMLFRALSQAIAG